MATPEYLDNQTEDEPAPVAKSFKAMTVQDLYKAEGEARMRYQPERRELIEAELDARGARWPTVLRVRGAGDHMRDEDIRIIEVPVEIIHLADLPRVRAEDFMPDPYTEPRRKARAL